MSTTGATGQRLSLRLFLEGIEVPVIAATVQVNLNSPATAAIQIVPLDDILSFKARTMVHLFFYDYTKDLPEPPPGSGPENRTDAPIPLSNYCLLFSGEVIGLAMQKTSMGRGCDSPVRGLLDLLGHRVSDDDHLRSQRQLPHRGERCVGRRQRHLQ